MKKKLPTQTILPTDADRAAFKKRCKELLRPLEDEFGIAFEFGRIDEIKGDFNYRSKMKCYSKRVKEPTLWDSPAAIALVNSFKQS
jgi:hypothetical protein